MHQGRRHGGRGPGRLTVVSLGPGSEDLITPQCLAALERAEVLVGYTPYLDLVPEAAKAGKDLVSTGMRHEVDRAEAALDAALDGRDVAVVSSGDAGVYGMAGLILEMVETRGLRDVLDPEIMPGIPALTAAAALLGAPLTHDFAVISLSDLLTPWPVIERRLEAAAQADFTTAIYNPRSRRRHWQLGKALELLAAHRSPDTPVGLVRQAFRQDQAVSVHRLADFDPSAVDMVSIVIVGNASSRIVGGRFGGDRMLTPRGYAGKYDLDK